MNDAEARDAGLVDAFKAANPELEVGVDGIFHEHRHVVTCQGIGYFLHGKGVGCRACANPEHVDASLERSLNVALGGYLGGYLHAEFLLHAVEPRQAFLADALEASGLGAGLPDAGAEYLDALACQLGGGVHHLFFGLGRAGTGNHGGTLRAGCAQEVEGREL